MLLPIVICVCVCMCVQVAVSNGRGSTLGNTATAITEEGSELVFSPIYPIFHLLSLPSSPSLPLFIACFFFLHAEVAFSCCILYSLPLSLSPSSLSLLSLPLSLLTTLSTPFCLPLHTMHASAIK